MIKKINTIKNMAVFKDFRWADSLEDFKHINVFYGRNYSGKTTISRIFRAFEVGSISDKYNSPQFNLELSNGKNLTDGALSSHGQTIRVFNEDFVKENLSFITDDERGTINSFAILGENNTKIEKEIKQAEIELGNAEHATGLRGKLVSSENQHQSLHTDWTKRNADLNRKLADKATNRNTGVKYNSLYGIPNYDIRKMKLDITKVVDKNFISINQIQIDKYQELLREQPKQDVPKLKEFNLQYAYLKDKTEELITKEIKVSDPIKELLADAALNNWVRTGRDLHKNKRTTCAFCGNILDNDLTSKLDRHFSEESENLIDGIDELIATISMEIDRVPNIFNVSIHDYYSEFMGDVEQQILSFENHSKSYIKSLRFLRRQLKQRRNDVFKPLEFKEFVNSIENTLLDVYSQYEAIRNRSNKFTNELSEKQVKAKDSLRLHEIYNFVNDIKYLDEVKAIDSLEVKSKEAETSKTMAQEEVLTKEKEIERLRSELKDESKGAEKVNQYLNNFFGHKFISLKPIENIAEDATNKYLFEVIRNGEKAFHLSEGESRLIAFCYFMAKLGDIDTNGKKPIIWIDDPISSLDSNHVFFVYSLINSQILKIDNFEQLFISTHNLEFLKFLKRLKCKYIAENGNQQNCKKKYFIVKRQYEISTLDLMPKYMIDHVSEFNYLFLQVYNCASIVNPDDSNYGVCYNFPNNARKFMEIYLYYKYPNEQKNDEKMLKFFGNNDIPALLTERINNEYSHLDGSFERGALVVDVAEIQKAAKFILKHLQLKDNEQYDALLESIGVGEKQE